MEAILGFIALVAIWFVIQLMFKGATAGAKATFNAATGKDSFSDSFKTQFQGLGDFRIQAVQSSKEISGYTINYLDIQARGLIPVPSYGSECSIYTHIFDITDESNKPVLSSLEEYSDPNSRTYQSTTNIGSVPPDSGYQNWVNISRIILDCIILPYSGSRTLEIQVCVVPTNNPPVFNLGFRSGNTGQVYAVSKTTYSYQTKEVGYLESIINRREVEELTIELGFHIAGSDEQLSPEEGTIIKEWVKDLLVSYNSDDYEAEKARLNQAITTSFEKATNGKIDIDNVIKRFNDISTVQEKYEAIELCLDVMKADSKIDENELKQIDLIAKRLEIDPDRLRVLQDRRLTEVKDIGTSTYNIAQILGITSEMSNEDIRKHLAKEYRKWNSRVSSDDENIRNKANEMLLHIANARRQYLSE